MSRSLANVSNAWFYKNELASDPKRIRLLTLNPVLEGSTLSGTLHSIPLDEVFSSTSTALVAYDALSYAWGPQNDMVEVSINGWIGFRVSRHLQSALRQLGGKTIWVDAICINQRSSLDKSQQVPLMRQIYSSANRVWIWLGECKCCQLVEHRKFHEKHAAALNLGTHTHWTIGGSDWRDPETRSKHWWHRVWTVQELALAAKPTVLCGSHVSSWSEFVLQLEELRESYSINNPQTYDDIKRLDSIRQMITTAAPNFDMQELLERTNGCLTSDPRDRVYGLLGLFERSVRGRSITVDYNLSTEEVYAGVAVHIINRNQNLDILYTCSRFPRSLSSSWIPQIGNAFGTIPDLTTYEAWPDPMLSDTVLRGTTLDLDAVVCDKIVKVICRLWLRSPPSHVFDDFPQIDQPFSTQTSSCNDVDDYNWHSQKEAMRPVTREPWEGYDKAYFTGEWYDSITTTFATKDGRLGVAYNQLYPGDCVAVLPGARLPFILRRISERRYKLVNECCVRGLMHRECLTMIAAGRAKIERITLV